MYVKMKICGQNVVRVKITVRKHCKIKGFRDIVEGSNHLRGIVLQTDTFTAEVSET